MICAFISIEKYCMAILLESKTINSMMNKDFNKNVADELKSNISTALSRCNLLCRSYIKCNVDAKPATNSLSRVLE